MNETTRSMIEISENDWQPREAANYQRTARPFRSDARRYRKAPRRAEIGFARRSAKRSTYKAAKLAKLAVA